MSLSDHSVVRKSATARSSYVPLMYVAAVFVLVLAAMPANALVVSERMPDGGYCGSYSHNLVVGRLNISQASSTVDVDIKGFGEEVICRNESYAYNPKTHRAVLVNKDDPNDCLGQLLRNASLEAAISFNPTTDTVTISVGFAHVACHKCA